MKNKNVTFSIPVELTEKLHSVVGKRGISKFVKNALEQALSEEVNSLKAAYKEAEADEERLAVIADWELLDTAGWDE